MSASSFTGVLLGPAIEVVIVVQRLVWRSRRGAPNQGIHRILQALQWPRGWGATEILGDGLPHERRQRKPPTRRSKLQIAIGLRRQPDVGRGIPRHRGTMVSHQKEPSEPPGFTHGRWSSRADRLGRSDTSLQLRSAAPGAVGGTTLSATAQASGRTPFAANGGFRDNERSRPAGWGSRGRERRS